MGLSSWRRDFLPVGLMKADTGCGGVGSISFAGPEVPVLLEARAAVCRGAVPHLALSPLLILSAPA